MPRARPASRVFTSTCATGGHTCAALCHTASTTLAPGGQAVADGRYVDELDTLLANYLVSGCKGGTTWTPSASHSFPATTSVSQPFIANGVVTVLGGTASGTRVYALPLVPGSPWNVTNGPMVSTAKQTDARIVTINDQFLGGFGTALYLYK